jgi:hypothetical protein
MGPKDHQEKRDLKVLLVPRVLTSLSGKISKINLSTFSLETVSHK